MRIVIRGARGAGKTSLLQRLQGNKWSERYVATPEIGIAHISWSYKTRDDIVKVRRLSRREFRAAASPQPGALGKPSGTGGLHVVPLVNLARRLQLLAGWRP